MSTRALILHSGGMDSTVCLLLAKEKGRIVTSLGIDYGQRHHVELDYAASQCERFRIERRILRVNWDKPKRILPLNRKVNSIGRTVSPGFLPARNGLFLMLACAEAAGLGATEIWVGVNSINFSGYPDCTPEFVTAFRKMLRVGIPGGPKIVAPLQLKSKRQIARIARDLRHTVGMRLREAEVREGTIADILWHVRPGMTAHYSVAQVAELVDALNRITDERSRTNRSLAMIAREARGEKVPIKSPCK